MCVCFGGFLLAQKRGRDEREDEMRIIREQIRLWVLFWNEKFISHCQCQFAKAG